MNQASVGWQCPNCVAEGRKTTRQTRTAFGGSMSGSAGLVTKILVGLNVGVFLIGLALAFQAGGVGAQNVLLGGASPLHLFGAMYAGPVMPLSDGFVLAGVASGDYWRLFTAMFLHYGIIHLAFNMYVLWVIGRYLERDLGPGRFLALYVICGLAGNVATYLFADPMSLSAGASGAIFGLFGAMVLVNRKLSRDNSGIYTLLILNLVITFIPGTNISITGHLGGLIMGLAIGFAISYAPRDNRTVVQVCSFVGALALMAAAVVWRTGDLLSQVPIG
ncbi:Peptidase S54 rhomboid domain-containing protein [Stackebrandtia soli]